MEREEKRKFGQRNQESVGKRTELKRWRTDPLAPDMNIILYTS